MGNIEVDRLIIKFINNTISEVESEKLESWLEHSDNLNYFNKFIKVNQLINSNRKFDHRYSLQQFLAKTQKQRSTKRGWYMAAAVVAVFLGVFTTFTIQNKIINENWERVVEKSKVSEPVKLITNHGEVVALSDSGNEVLQIDGEELEKSNNTIVYKKTQKEQKVSYHQLVVPVGKIYTITLADGSVITVNSDSKVRFATAFTGKTRDVWVHGEVFFDVAHDESKPFIVHTDGFETQVLGTKFNVRAYDDESVHSVTLVEGLVKLMSQNKTSKVLEPDYQYTYPVNFGFEQSEIDVVDTYKYVSWVDGIMFFDNLTLEDLMKRLSKWYSFSYEFENESIKGRLYTGGVKKDDNLHKIFEMLREVNDADFLVEGGRVIINYKD